MKFLEVSLSEGVVTATAEGHATEVVFSFHHLAGAILEGQGAWRITYVNGYSGPGTVLDSEMHWDLRAERKADIDARVRQGHVVYSRTPPTQEEMS